MTHGYLVLPSGRRIISVTFDTDADVCELLETGSVAHGTTLYSEDQLMVGERAANDLPPGRFFVSGVPFTFAGNALLVGEDQPNGGFADRPTMSIREFRNWIRFVTDAEVRRLVKLGAADAGYE